MFYPPVKSSVPVQGIRMNKRFIYREENINKYMLIIIWFTLAIVFVTYQGMKNNEILDVLKAASFFIVPTILHIFFKRLKATKYVLIACGLVFVFMLMHLQKGLFDNTFVLFIVLAGTAVYFNILLTILTMLALMAGSLIMYLANQPYYFPGFSISNFLILIVALAVVGVLITLQTVLGKRILSSQLELYHNATRDQLTSAYNRAFFDEVLAYSFSNCKAQSRDLTLVICDVDDLKAINDTYGHLSGDTVIKKMGEGLLASCRRSDIVARLGGDEFGMILYDVNSDEAQVVINKCKEYIRRAFGNGPFRMSASFGTADLSVADTPDDLYKYADEAMYLTKKTNQLNKMAAENGRFKSGEM